MDREVRLRVSNFLTTQPAVAGTHMSSLPASNDLCNQVAQIENNREHNNLLGTDTLAQTNVLHDYIRKQKGTALNLESN
jgi:hypothetical protein